MNRRERLREMIPRALAMAGGTVIVGTIIEKLNTPDHLGISLPVAAAATYIFAWIMDSKSTEASLVNEKLIELNPLVPPHPIKEDLYTRTRMLIEGGGLILSITQPEFGIGFSLTRIAIAINNWRVGSQF